MGGREGGNGDRRSEVAQREEVIRKERVERFDVGGVDGRVRLSHPLLPGDVQMLPAGIQQQVLVDLVPGELGRRPAVHLGVGGQMDLQHLRGHPGSSAVALLPRAQLSVSTSPAALPTKATVCPISTETATAVNCPFRTNGGSAFKANSALLASGDGRNSAPQLFWTAMFFYPSGDVKSVIKASHLKRNYCLPAGISLPPQASFYQ